MCENITWFFPHSVTEKQIVWSVKSGCINSSPPSAAYVHHWIGSALLQLMACRLFGAKPLPEPILAYFELDSWEQISVKVELKFCHFHSRKCIWKCRLPKCRPFCPGGDELNGLWQHYRWQNCIIRAITRLSGHNNNIRSVTVLSSHNSIVRAMAAL